jgi:hypothetical protein
LSTGIDFDVPDSTKVPEFSFVSVTKHEVCNAVMPIKSNDAGVDEIPLSFIKSLLPVLLGTMTHVFNHIFTCSEFPAKWGASVVLPIPKVAVPIKFTDYRPIRLLACFSKVFDILMTRLIKAHVRRNKLLTVFQSGFCPHYSTTVAVLKFTEDIRSNMEDGPVTVLVLLDFSRPFDMVIHGLLL